MTPADVAALVIRWGRRHRKALTWVGIAVMCVFAFGRLWGAIATALLARAWWPR